MEEFFFDSGRGKIANIHLTEAIYSFQMCLLLIISNLANEQKDAYVKCNITGEEKDHTILRQSGM